MPPFGNIIEEIFLLILKKGDNRLAIEKRCEDFCDKDWEALYELSVRNGLFPIFYTRLTSLKLENIPPEFLSRLKYDFAANLKKNIILERESFNILSYLEKTNIPAIPLKGPFLARYLYDDLALRQASCDIDILIPPGRLGEAERKLEETGYHYSHHREADFFRKFRKEITLQKDNISLDLHWNFSDKYINAPIEEFWRNARYMDFDGHRALSFSDEDTVLYIALTAIADFDFILPKYLYDIHKAICKFGRTIDWDTLISRARGHRLDRALFFALKSANELFDTGMPRAFKKSFFSENLLKIWINKNNILRNRVRIASSYSWRYFASSYIYSKNLFDCARTIYDKIFLPVEEAMGLWDEPLLKKSYSLYIKRLLNPGNRIFSP